MVYTPIVLALAMSLRGATPATRPPVVHAMRVTAQAAIDAAATPAQHDDACAAVAVYLTVPRSQRAAEPLPPLECPTLHEVPWADKHIDIKEIKSWSR